MQFNIGDDMHFYKGDKRCFYNNKFLFVNISKNTSTSIRTKLSLKIINFDEIPNTDSLYKFIVLREPFDRFVSSFIEAAKPRMKETLNTNWYKLYKEGKYIESILDVIKYIEVNGHFYDLHFSPQYMFLESKNIDLSFFDLVIDYNNLYDTWKNDNVLNKYGLSKMNASNKAIKQKIFNLFKSDDNIVNFVKSYYKKDFELYNSII